MAVQSYKCPACGAGIAFDIETQKWACKFCGSVFDRLDGAETPGAPEGASSAETPPVGDGAAYEHTVRYSCPSCGGAILADETTAATFCVYCHNPAILSERVEGVRRPERMIPFKLGKDTVKDALAKYCRRRPLLPGDFRAFAEKGEVSGLYVPFWLHSAEIRCRMSAEGKQISTWSDARYVYTKTDTYEVEREADVAFQGVPADGSARMDDRLMEQLEPFNAKEMTAFDPAYLSGHFAETYDVDAEESGKRALPRMEKAAEGMTRETITGYQSVSLRRNDRQTLRRSHEYALLPVWTLMARYKEKQYAFAMNGQTGKLAGNLPISGKRALFWAAAAAAVCFGLLLLALTLTAPAPVTLDTRVVFTETTGGLTIQEFARQQLPPGGGDGILLAVAWQERETHIYPTGVAEELFSYDRLGRMLDELAPVLRTSDEAAAEAAFRRMVAQRLDGYARTLGTSLLYALLGGLALGGLTTGILVIVHKASLSKAAPGRAYLEPGGFCLTRSEDRFLRTHTARVPIPRNTGGGHGGGGGRSVGGRSGRF
jgi:DNA-directed RNA polymerase subunit RPC12/RpoP